MNRLLAAALFLAGPLVLGACDSTNGDDDIIRRAFVTRVIIDDFPLSNPAAGGWDGGGDGQADLYFRILGSNGVQLLNGEESSLVTADGQAGSRVFTDAGIEDIPVTFTVADFEIDALDRSLTIELKDDDPVGADEIIGESTPFRLENFIPDPLPSNRQAIIPFMSADSLVSGRLTVRFAS